MLPGLRDLRAPFAAGFLWLLVAWLILHRDFANADGTIGELVALARTVPDAALTGFVVFVAYIVGSVSSDIGSFASRGLVDRASAGTPKGKPPVNHYWREGLSPSQIEIEVHLNQMTADRCRAERELRTAILPPLMGLGAYVSLTDGWAWCVPFGLLILALCGQVCYRAKNEGYATDVISEKPKGAVELGSGSG